MFIGDADVTHMTLQEKIENVAPTTGQSRSAYSLWALISHIGYVNAQSVTAKSTWYRAIKILRAAGLSDSDLRKGIIVPIRKKHISITEPVSCWEDIAA